MTDKNLTEIILVVDRSGSMSTTAHQAEEGIKSFIQEQSMLPGRAKLTLVQFDTEVETKYDHIDINRFNGYSLNPRGLTALLDAVGITIKKVGERLAKTPEAKRPGLVVFAIITDGYENASTIYSRKQIADMIREQKDKYSWQFTYLGSDASAFLEAEALGIDKGLTMWFNPTKTTETYRVFSSNLASTRCDTANGLPATMSYTAEDRKAVE